MNKVPKDYLGDGVYASCDGYSIVISTENGIRTTNSIVFDDPNNVDALLRFIQRCGFRIILDGGGQVT